MPTTDFITELFCRIDDTMREVPRHPQSKLYPSEIVTLGVLFALKGVGLRAFYRWVRRDLGPLFPHLPERTRLFRLFATHQDWTDRFLASPTVLGVADTFGVELIHPMREGRSPNQIGKKGKSNRRWIVGAKLCYVVNSFGLIVGWDCATANVHDSAFLPLIQQFQEHMIVLTDQGFHSKDADPPNLKVCQPKRWNVRMVIESVLAMLNGVCHAKKMSHRVWDALRARFAFLMSAFNILASWHGLVPDKETGFVSLSIAEFSL
jgi:hypothetical protein